MRDVVIDGVRYVRDPSHATEVRFFFMHDNHTFTSLRGTTIDEVLAYADRLESGEHGSYGMLCPVVVLNDAKEIRRVGPPAFSRGRADPKDYWNAGKAKWRAAVEADPDVMRVLSSNASNQGQP